MNGWSVRADTAELVNYHHATSTQRDALDILQMRDGHTHEPGSTELTSYYIYGKPVLAPAAGTVTFVLDGRPDQRIGSTDSHYQSGNNIVIDVGGGRYLLMAHLIPGSIQVEGGRSRRAGPADCQSGELGQYDRATPPHTGPDHRHRHRGYHHRWTRRPSFVRCTPTRWCSPMSCSPGAVANLSSAQSPIRGVAICSGQPVNPVGWHRNRGPVQPGYLSMSTSAIVRCAGSDVALGESDKIPDGDLEHASQGPAGGARSVQPENLCHEVETAQQGPREVAR